MGCELCEQTGGTLLEEDARCRVVLVEEDDYPGFCRVIWKHHVKEMTDLSNTDRLHMMMILFAVETSIRETLQPEKINLASLGNMTPHLHWHIIPRYIQDKHYPQPIWGTIQRPGKSSLPLDWKVRLMESAGMKLKEIFK